MDVVPPITPPGGSVDVLRCWVGNEGVVVDGVVVSFRLAAVGAAEAAVGTCRPVFGRPAPNNLRSRSRFLSLPSDIFRDTPVMWMIRTAFELCCCYSVGVPKRGLDVSEALEDLGATGCGEGYRKRSSAHCRDNTRS